MFDTLYSPSHRALHDEFDSRRMADLMKDGLCHDKLQDPEIAYIQSLDMFFLATVGPDGSPTVSYKGGAPGTVTVVDPGTLVFPSYDGNGMFLSMGNLAATAKVGLLFIDFQTPNRLRVQGSARIVRDHPLKEKYPEAQFLVEVAIENIFINCARYIHKRVKVEDSKYVPKAECETPVPSWKRIDFVQPSLPGKDQNKAADNGGLITMDDYVGKLMAGDS
jgi:predicted pyridoxine 5'-phosphate oxidase superfamily flavin-nucleotide-binding protein